MRSADPTTAAIRAALPDPHALTHAIVERQLHMLTRLAEMGMNIAEAAERWALAALDSGPAPYVVPENHVMADEPGRFRGDPALVFSRVSRAVRLTLMLQTRLLQELPALAKAETQSRVHHENARHDHARRLVEHAIKAEHEDGETVERLVDEARERLRDEDFGEDIDGRPLSEIVAGVCTDLGLSPDWSAWAVAAATGGDAPPREPPPPDDPPPPAPSRPAGALRAMAGAPMGRRRPTSGPRTHSGPDPRADREIHSPRPPAGAHGAPPGPG